METSAREELRHEIDTQLSALHEEIAALEEATKPIAPDVAIGRISRMDAINNKAINESSLNRSRERLHQLETAAGRLDDPDFGTCAVCQQPIPIKRLMYLPSTTRCVQCASR